jgi:hypothetical protein
MHLPISRLLYIVVLERQTFILDLKYGSHSAIPRWTVKVSIPETGHLNFLIPADPDLELIWHTLGTLTGIHIYLFPQHTYLSHPLPSSPAEADRERLFEGGDGGETVLVEQRLIRPVLEMDNCDEGKQLGKGGCGGIGISGRSENWQ